MDPQLTAARRPVRKPPRPRQRRHKEAQLRLRRFIAAFAQHGIAGARWHGENFASHALFGALVATSRFVLRGAAVLRLRAGSLAPIVNSLSPAAPLAKFDPARSKPR